MMTTGPHTDEYTISTLGYDGNVKTHLIEYKRFKLNGFLFIFGFLFFKTKNFRHKGKYDRKRKKKRSREIFLFLRN